MKQVRLGPLALLLTVITISMAIFAVLAWSTANADYRLAEKYADHISEQYFRETAGQEFLSEADAILAADGSLTELENVIVDGDIVEKDIQEGNATLKIGLREENGSYTIVYWYSTTAWNPEPAFGNLWLG